MQKVAMRKKVRNKMKRKIIKDHASSFYLNKGINSPSICPNS